MRRLLALAVLGLALVLHGMWLERAWARMEGRPWAADFATYYYAVKVAADGGSPYDTAALGARATAEKTRSKVHPYFYPPPFLLTMLWAVALPLHAAYLAWFWVDEAFAVLCALILARWWRPLDASAPWVAAVAVATLTAIPDNHLMGQVNLPVLALVLGGVWLGESGRERAAGVLVGLACMLKMSPALFVAWWMLRGRWRAVGASLVTAVGLSLLSLPWAGPEVQREFYLQVLPGFGTGDYNGLRVSIGLFANYSVPELFHRQWPSGANVLSPTARAASLAFAAGLVGALAWWFRRAPTEPWSIAGQVGAIAVVMLLIPVYTYEHHLVWAIPAVVVSASAVLAGRLHRAWGLLVVPAWLAWAWSLPMITGWAKALADTSPWAHAALREAKTAALFALLVACLAIVPRRR